MENYCVVFCEKGIEKFRSIPLEFEEACDLARKTRIRFKLDPKERDFAYVETAQSVKNLPVSSPFALS